MNNYEIVNDIELMDRPIGKIEGDGKLKKDFIIDEDTFYNIIDNSVNICNKKINGEICYECKKEIIQFFADNCKEFEENILYNKCKGIRVKKTKYGSLNLFFDSDEIRKNYKVISSWDFVNLALTNIFFNSGPCNNMYFRVSPILTKGTKFKMLENHKNYIKIFLDMFPQANDLPMKGDINKFSYLKIT